MKTLIITLAAAVALALVAGDAHAQVTKLPPPIHKTRAGIEVGTRVTDVVGLEIKQAYARRNAAAAHSIVVMGVLQNTFTREIKASWTLMKWDGSSWVNVRKESDVLVPPNGTKPVTIRLPATNDALRFRWAVSWTKPSTQQVAKEFRLPAKILPPPEELKATFVVRYMTQNGGEVCCTDGTLELAKMRYHLARSFGFNAKIVKTTSTFSSSERYRLYVWLEKEEQRRFETLEEAKKCLQQVVTIDIESPRTGGRLILARIDKE